VALRCRFASPSRALARSAGSTPPIVRLPHLTARRLAVQIGGPTGGFVVIVSGSCCSTASMVCHRDAHGRRHSRVAFGLLRLAARSSSSLPGHVSDSPAGIALIIFSSQIRDLLGLECSRSLRVSAEMGRLRARIRFPSIRGRSSSPLRRLPSSSSGLGFRGASQWPSVRPDRDAGLHSLHLPVETSARGSVRSRRPSKSSRPHLSLAIIGRLAGPRSPSHCWRGSSRCSRRSWQDG